MRGPLPAARAALPSNTPARATTLAAFDAEIARGIQDRDSRRHRIFKEILKRLATAERNVLAEEEFNSLADVLAMLTGFASYDALAGAGHSAEQITATLIGLAHFATG